jgi:HEAT repeat protein
MKRTIGILLAAPAALAMGAIGFAQGRNPSLAELLDQFQTTNVRRQLGQLRDPRAFEILVPLLDDAEINYEVAWALGEIGDRRAIRPLIAVLRDRHAVVRTLAIQSLERLRATEALPAIRALLTDRALPSAGDQVSVGETAKAVIAKLQREP